MEEIEIKKTYKKVVEKQTQIYSEQVKDQSTGEVKSVRKEREIEVEVEKLLHDTKWAFGEAQKKADKLKYISVSLLCEDERGWKFQLYNKVG